MQVTGNMQARKEIHASNGCVMDCTRITHAAWTWLWAVLKGTMTPVLGHLSTATVQLYIFIYVPKALTAISHYVQPIILYFKCSTPTNQELKRQQPE